MERKTSLSCRHSAAGSGRVLLELLEELSKAGSCTDLRDRRVNLGACFHEAQAFAAIAPVGAYHRVVKRREIAGAQGEVCPFSWYKPRTM